MADTWMRYNGIKIRDVLTDSIDQTVVADSTGVDPLYTRIEVTCTGTIHLTSGDLDHGYTLQGGFAAGWSAILAKLMQPRREFVYTVAGSTLFSIKPGAIRQGAPGGVATSMAGMDVNNGPLPSAKITGIVSGRVARVQFRIVCHVPLCDTGGSSGSSNSGVINMRYWIAEDINGQDWTTTRIYQGRIRVAHAGINVHQAIRRHLVMPPLQGGFWRKSIKIQQAPNGLEADFTVIDEELWAQAPKPAQWWDGHHTVSSPMAGGAIAESELKVELKANKDVDKQDLLTLATKILEAKLHLFDMANQKRTFLLYAAYSDSLAHNHITAQAKIRHVGGRAGTELWNVIGKDLGTPVLLDDYNKEIQDYGHQTATMAGLFAQRLQDPCSPAEMPQTANRAVGDTTPSPGDTVVYITDGELTDHDPAYSTSHTEEGAYTDYTLTSEIRSKSGMIDLPVGDASNNPGVNGEATVVVLPVHQGWARRTVRVTAERLNAWPELPAWNDFTDDNGIKYTLLQVRPVPSSPVLSADAKKTLHRVDMELVYSMSRPPRNNESLPLGRIPYRDDSQLTVASVTSVPASAFLASGGSGSNRGIL